MSAGFTPELVDAVAQAIWEGGRFKPREVWASLPFGEKETVRFRAEAAIRAIDEYRGIASEVSSVGGLK